MFSHKNIPIITMESQVYDRGMIIETFHNVKRKLLQIFSYKENNSRALVSVRPYNATLTRFLNNGPKAFAKH